MDDDFFNERPPHGPASLSNGSPSAPAAEGSFASNGATSPLSPPIAGTVPAGGPAAVAAVAAVPPAVPASVQSAPWDDDDWGATPSPPAPQPPQRMAPAANNLTAPSVGGDMPPPPPAAPATATESKVAPTSAMQPQPQHAPAEMSFVPSSPSGASVEGDAVATPTGPTAPTGKPVSSAAFDALQKQIANRTATYDAATRKKEAELTEAAAQFIKQQKAKREREVADAKARHKQDQQAGAKKIDDYRKSGAVWSAVGMLVDLQKPNPYCQKTERMRSVLSTLKEAGAPAAAATR